MKEGRVTASFGDQIIASILKLKHPQMHDDMSKGSMPVILIMRICQISYHLAI